MADKTDRQSVATSSLLPSFSSFSTPFFLFLLSPSFFFFLLPFFFSLLLCPHSSFVCQLSQPAQPDSSASHATDSHKFRKKLHEFFKNFKILVKSVTKKASQERSQNQPEMCKTRPQLTTILKISPQLALIVKLFLGMRTSHLFKNFWIFWAEIQNLLANFSKKLRSKSKPD